jgi:putative transposase
MARTPYPTDLTDAQWALVEPLIPRGPASPGGRPRSTPLRRVIDALSYLVRTGCSWRMLPRDFPPWRTVYEYKMRFEGDGTWERLHDALRGKARVAAGRDPSPSAAIIDSQTVRTFGQGGARATTRRRR